MGNPNTEQKLVSISRTTDPKGQVTLSPLFLKKIYSAGSLRNLEDGVMFCIKNPMKDAYLTGINGITINGIEVPLDGVVVRSNGSRSRACEIGELCTIPFPMGEDVDVQVPMGALTKNRDHEIILSFTTDLYGTLELETRDTVIETRAQRQSIPYRKGADYDPEIVRSRQEFVEDFTGASLHHVKHYSFEPEVAKGNIENFTGVAQVPLGFAGPLKVNGEHAKGEFLIPLCTSEGTLVASYNRGMKIINMCGGVKTT
ncbi:MAG: hydroxymethylglutaryl-CoA reductase, partial [Desulfomonilia bacterium]|nr:hydroxymethylglutaryl-CoA reductase [Desulfomonilia bacterium]